MERKILKSSCIVVPLILVCLIAFLSVFPAIQARSVAHEEQVAMSTQADEVIAEPDYTFTDPEAVVEDDEDLGDRIRVELPEGVSESEANVSNDYLTQTVTIQFPTDCSDYFSKYHVQGSSSHIKAVSYSYKNGKGILMLGLNRLYEASCDFKSGKLYLSFTDPHDIYDKVVVVDAGHGGKAAGATKKDVCEKDIDLEIVLELKKIFDSSDENIGVYYTRLDDSNPRLGQRVGLANAADADLFVSIHNNASSSGRFSTLHGTQVLYSESDESEFSSKRFAQICLEQVVASCESRNIGLLPGDDIYIIRSSKVPVALIEVGFLTNQKELENLCMEEYRRSAAQGVYNAVIQAFEEGY